MNLTHAATKVGKAAGRWFGSQTISGRPFAPRGGHAGFRRASRGAGWLCVLAVSMVVFALAKRSEAKTVAILLSAEVPEYMSAVEGFKETIGHSIVAVYNMEGDLSSGRRFLSELENDLKPDLLLVVGVWALRLAIREELSTRIVFAMVVNPQHVIGDPGARITGASMDVPARWVVRLFQQLSPDIRRVGVLFDPENTASLLEQARSALRGGNLQLVSRAIRSAGEAVAAMDTLAKMGIDAVWLLPDETVLTPVVLEHMLLFSLRRQIPLIGLAPRHSEMGALASASFASSEDIGRQAGELANRALAGEAIAQIPYTTARRVRLTLNLKTAGKLGMKIPEGVIEMADGVIQ